MKPIAACALALILIAPAPALARDALPWKDANPVGRIGERPKAKPANRRAQAQKVAAPIAATAAAATSATGAAASVPVPEARPASPSEPVAPESAAPEPAAPGPSAPPPAAEAAKPEPRPADAPAEEPAQPADKTPANEAAAEKDSSAEVAPAADKPVTDIPVPDERPAPTPAEVAPAPAPEPAPPPPAAAVPAPTPEASPPPPPAAPAAKPEEAPNSTEKLKSRELDVTPAATVEAAAAVEDSIACEAELKSRGAEFTVDETISEGECGVLRPVALKRLSSGIAVAPKTQMLCRTALALDDWMTKSVVPAAKADLAGETLTEFRHASTYVCRPRASETGISEHARGSAIDIGSFVFKNGREIGIAAKAANTPDETFLEAVRTGACGPFKTVLGPGTDADHATHFHLDIAARKNGSTYCK